MPFEERLGWMILGCCVGFALGYISRMLQDIKKKVDTVDQHVTHPKNDDGLLRHPLALDLVLFLVVVMTLWSLWKTDNVNDELQESYESDRKQLCASGQDSRNVQRDLVDSIYTLATGNLERPKNAPPLTRFEVRQYNSYIQRVNVFRSDMYDKIRPSDVCEPYVDDKNVKPKTPPYPKILFEEQ